MGANSDSFYEYLLKVWLYKSKKDPEMLKMYNEAVDSLKRNVIRQSKSGLYYAGDYPFTENSMPKMEHLACFSGGMFALSAMSMPFQKSKYITLAQEITKTCHLSYTNTITKLGPGC